MQVDPLSSSSSTISNAVDTSSRTNENNASTSSAMMAAGFITPTPTTAGAATTSQPVPSATLAAASSGAVSVPVAGRIPFREPPRHAAATSARQNHAHHPHPPASYAWRKDSRPPSQYDWMVHQSTIRRLYLEEKRPLKDVMLIMRRDFGFDAGLKTYKSHMKTWGYRKNISLRDEQADQLSTILAAHPPYVEHQDAVSLGDGRLIARDRLATHLRRRKEYLTSSRRSIGSISPPGASPTWPPDDNTQMTITITPPATLQLPETLFTLITQYIRGRWEGTLFTAAHFENGRDASMSTPDSNALFYMARGVSEVLKEGKLAPALVLMRQAPLAFQQTIAAQQRSLISRVFTSMLALTNHAVALSPADAKQLNAVVRSLIKVGATFAAQQTAPGDPLRRILELVAAADESQLHAIAERALRVNCDAFDALVGDGPKSSSHFIQWIAYGQEVDFETVPRDLNAQFEKSLAAYGEMYGEQHPRTTYIRYLYGWCLHYTDESAGKDPYSNPKIEHIFNEYYQSVSQAARADVMEWLATACKNRDHRGLAEKYMREALDGFSREGKSKTPLAVAISVRLQTWLTEWGEEAKAAELVQQREGLLDITSATE